MNTKRKKKGKAAANSQSASGDDVKMNNHEKDVNKQDSPESSKRSVDVKQVNKSNKKLKKTPPDEDQVQDENTGDSSEQAESNDKVQVKRNTKRQRANTSKDKTEKSVESIENEMIDIDEESEGESQNESEANTEDEVKESRGGESGATETKSLDRNKATVSETNSTNRKSSRKRKATGGNVSPKKMKKEISDDQENVPDGDEEDTGQKQPKPRETKKALLKSRQNQADKPQRGQKSPAKKSTKTAQSTKQKEYEVAQIVTMRTRRDKREFLVRWKGYSKKHDTWEPETNLNCDSLLAEFLKGKN